MPSAETIKAFVMAAHHDLRAVQEHLSQEPAVLDAGHDWGNGDVETAIMAAAHVGNRAIAEFLVEQGAPMAIYTAAMLGRRDAVARLLGEDPTLANARGAHGISLMFHAAMSGDTALAQLLKDAGCREGYDQALIGAVNHGHKAMVAWLLDNGADNLRVTNFQGKTPLQLAQDRGHNAIAELLRARGGDA